MYRKINTRKTAAIFFLLLISTHSYSQTASVVFQHKKNENFQVSINYIKQQQNYSNTIKINQLKGNMPYNVKINFENDTTVVQKNIFLIDDGLTHIYDITKETIQVKKIVPAASYPKSENQLTVNFIINNEIIIDTAAIDTNAKDTAYVVPFETYYKLEDYEGRIGCPFPIKDIEQGELRGVILAENLEESKLEKIITAIQEMDSACVLVEQTKELIFLFEFEETRLEFAKFMFTYTFDIDNYEKLYPAFNYDNSKDELKQFIGIKDQ